jgi:glycerol transport system ATP-binding protein
MSRRSNIVRQTSLMRLMAGLDSTQAKSSGTEKDVTGMRVQDRGVAMVYQQFIYPSMTVYENISPMRL